MKNFEYVTPDSFESAVEFLGKRRWPEDGLAKAGGIDVLDRLKEHIEEPKRLLNLRPLKSGMEAVALHRDEKRITISALATLAEVAEHTDVRKLLPALADAAGHAATPQIRNVATIGGNLCQKPRCWYYRSVDFDCAKKGGPRCFAVIGDNRYHAIFGCQTCHIVHPSNTAPALLAYDATVQLLKHEDGKPRVRALPISEFFRVPTNPQDDEHVLEPGELITHIHIPLPTASLPRSAYVELREKQTFDWPLVACAVNLADSSNPRVVLGAVAPMPWRLKNVEALLAGTDVNDAVIDKAKAIATDGAEPMTGNGYKLQLVRVALERALRKALQ